MTDHLSSDQLIDFVHGELPPEADARAHAHLASCSLCRSAYDAEIALGEALRASPLGQELEFPSSIKAAVWEQIRNSPPSLASRLTAWLRPALAVPALAVVALGLWIAGPLGHRGVAPTIDATYYLRAHAAQTSGSPLSDATATRGIETSMLEGSDGAAPTLEGATDTGLVTTASIADAMR